METIFLLPFVIILTPAILGVGLWVFYKTIRIK